MLIPTMGRSLVVALLLRCGNADALEKAPELQLASGTVKGSVVSDGVQQYLGVPFAEPPGGKLRWQPPVDWAMAATHDGSGRTYGGTGPYFGQTHLRDGGMRFVPCAHSASARNEIVQMVTSAVEQHAV